MVREAITQIGSIQSKISWQTKNQENVNSHGKGQSIDSLDKMTQMLELCDKGFRALITKMLPGNGNACEIKDVSLSNRTENIKSQMET